MGFLIEKANNKEGPPLNNQNQDQDVPSPGTLQFSPGFTPPNDNSPPPLGLNPLRGNPPSFGL